MRPLVLLAVLGFATLCPALHGVISQDTVWADTVLLDGDICVRSNAALTIAPGTQVLVGGSPAWDANYDGVCSLLIDGKLNAIGTEQDTIVFASEATWSGIALRGTEADSIRYARIVGGLIGVRLEFTRAVIANCEISRCPSYGGTTTGVGIHCHSSSGEIRGNLIGNCTIGIVCESSSPIIARNTIRDCGEEYAGDLALGDEPRDGTGVLCLDQSSPVLTQNWISDIRPGIGVAGYGTAAGVRCRSASRPVIGGSPDAANRLSATFVVPGHSFAVVNETPSSIDARWNDWTVCDSLSIDSIIIDHADSNAFGRVLYSPWVGYTPPQPPDTLHPDTLYFAEPVLFSRRCAIRYGVTASTPVRVSICDAAGRELRVLANTSRTPGVYYLYWLGNDERNRQVSAGAYFCRFEAAGRVRVLKLVKLE